jgi:hypothetical protein
MKAAILFCLVVLAVAVSSVPVENNLPTIGHEVWRCIAAAVKADQTLIQSIKTCIGKGGDVVSCLKAIPAIRSCFPA